MTSENDNTLHQFSEQLADAVEFGAHSVYLVDGRKRMPASAVLIGENSLLAADHAIEGDGPVPVQDPDGGAGNATIVGRDPGSDLALLSLDDGAGIAASFSETPARVGQVALALGRPGPNGVQASFGIVSAIGSMVRSYRRRGRGRRSRAGHSRKTNSAEQILRTDAVPYPGFSGGPLIDSAGHVLGINTSGLHRGVSIAIPIARAAQIAAALREHGSVRRGYLGIRSQPAAITSDQQSLLNREQASGLLIVWVEAESPAAQGGLLVGDIIVGMNDVSLADAEDLQVELAGNSAGASAEFQLLRGGQVLQTSLVVGERV
jgi:S1-C subfamily serine protease